MRRVALPRALAIVVGLTIALIVGGTANRSALSVEGTHLSASQVNTDLATVSSSTEYLCYLNASALIRSSGHSGLGSVAGSTPATYSATFVTNWLDQKITNLIVSHQVQSLGLSAQATADLATAKYDLENSITATLTQVAGSQSQCTGTAASILASLPAATQHELIQAQADSEVILVHDGGIGTDDASLHRYYNASPTSFDTYCVSGILVANQATAQAVRQQLAAGANFAALAAQVSTDASKARGGALGFFAPSSGNYNAVLKDVGTIGVGGLTQPLASSGGSYVILTVTSQTPTPYNEIANAVRQSVLAQDAKTAQAKITSVVRHASVSLDPRFGTWTASSVQTGVTPPGSPPAADVLNASANIPGASG